MITKEQAVNLVKEFENVKLEKIKQEANDFVSQVVSPKIEAIAKRGGRMVDISVAEEVDCDAVMKILVDNGFSLLFSLRPRDLTISW